MSGIACIREDVEVVTSPAAKHPATIDPRTRQIDFVADGACFMGSSSVAVAGANVGAPLATGDRAIANIDGAGATDFWFIAAAPTTIRVIQRG